MFIVIFFTLLGLVLMFKRIHQTLKVYTVISYRMKQDRPLYHVKGSVSSIFGFFTISMIAVMFIFWNIHNPLMAGFSIMVSFISIGEFINTITLFSFYYDNLGFYYYHYYISRKDIIKLNKTKGILNLTMIYSIETKNGQKFSICKTAYEKLNHMERKS